MQPLLLIAQGSWRVCSSAVAAPAAAATVSRHAASGLRSGASPPQSCSTILHVLGQLSLLRQPGDQPL